jgi:hypothetical protein
MKKRQTINMSEKLKTVKYVKTVEHRVDIGVFWHVLFKFPSYIFLFSLLLQRVLSPFGLDEATES